LLLWKLERVGCRGVDRIDECKRGLVFVVVVRWVRSCPRLDYRLLLLLRGGIACGREEWLEECRVVVGWRDAGMVERIERLGLVRRGRVGGGG
jgi:hypothetical protein